MDKTQLKNAFARFVTGITVVSCKPREASLRPIGITANSFTSVSLEPPLVLWCLDKRSSVLPHFSASDHYAVSILSADQQSLSERFASPDTHHFEGVQTELKTSGAPLLRDRLSGLDCEIVPRHEAGDHIILVGKVMYFDYLAGKPLMYVGREYVQGPVITEE